jgi:outer membrane protein assembly factor BamB
MENRLSMSICPWIKLLACVCLCGPGSALVLADHWPGSRGPSGCGLTTESNLPLEWNAKTAKNVRWSVAADGQGTASPIVWGDRVFVANVAAGDNADQPLHQISCFQAQDGKRLWKTLVEPGPFKRGGLKGGRGNGYANATPCTDGERVYAVFGSSVLVAVDFSGKQVWRYELKPFNYGSSQKKCNMLGLTRS